MAQLELAQQELTKVGAALMKAIKTGEAAQLQVMPILKQLKKVNTALTAVINGEDDADFSFDSIEESAPAPKSRKMEEQKSVKRFSSSRFLRFIHNLHITVINRKFVRKCNSKN